MTLVGSTAVESGYWGSSQGHVFLSVVLSAAQCDLHLRQSCTCWNVADLDRVVAVMGTFISLQTLLSSHSLGIILASLAGFSVFPLSSICPGARLCSSLGLWQGGCLLRNIIKYTLYCFVVSRCQETHLPTQRERSAFLPLLFSRACPQTLLGFSTFCLTPGN